MLGKCLCPWVVTLLLGLDVLTLCYWAFPLCHVLCGFEYLPVKLPHLKVTLQRSRVGHQWTVVLDGRGTGRGAQPAVAGYFSHSRVSLF